MSDLWLEHLANGEAYACENFIVGVGGLFPHVQIFNPSGSGKRIRVYTLHATAGAAVTGSLRRHDTELLTAGPPRRFYY